jgi:DNA-binding winged helix-turn-helix (wHTH) protein/tetratricopeptide (TPR) repeat protein
MWFEKSFADSEIIWKSFETSGKQEMKLVEKPVVYEFDRFRLDAANRLLWRDGELVPLTAKVFDTLLFFVENSGRLLEKDEVMKRVWEGSFVEESNLARNVSTLRRALGEDSKSHHFIVTIPGHGYKFVAQVRRVQHEAFPPLVIAEQSISTTIIEEELSLSDGDTGASTLLEAQKANASTSYFQRNRKLIFVIAAVACLTLTLLIGFALLRSHKPVPITNHSPISIAVLPLNPVNAENRDPVYELGIADSLILKLSSVKEILVRPLSATRKYTSLDQDPLAAGREQQVDYVLSLNYQLADGKIRLTAQLFNVRDSSVASVFTCDEKCTDIFATEDAISEKVGRLLLTRLSKEQKNLLAKDYTANEEAYRLYLQGKYFLDRPNEGNFRKAIDAFEHSIRLDPNYVLVYVELAWAHRSLSFGGLDTLGGESQKAKDAVMKALALDDSLAEDYSALGEIQDNYEWNFTAGEQSHKRALELNPNSSRIHAQYGIHLMNVGRLDEAVAEIKSAIELDPTSLFNNRLLGDALYWSRRYDEAIAQFRRVIAMDAKYDSAYHFLSSAYAMQGDYEQAFEWYFALHRQIGASAGNLRVIKTAYTKMGWRGILQHEIEQLQQAQKEGVHNDSMLASFYARLGDREQAFRCLEKAYKNRESWLVTILINPELDLLRSDPRFDELLKRIGLK